ncbi:MAG: hypothetical protein AAB932_05390 [Patescibacteria group bacterium]
MKNDMFYSDHAIFFDTEFTDLDIRKGELLSIGMVKMTGEELYLELAYDGTVHPWVKKHVLPSLTEKKYTKEDAREKLWAFMGRHKKEAEKPYLVAYVNQFDAVFWYDLFGSAKGHPAYWIPIDFASILFAHGYDPNSLGKKAFFTSLGIDKSAFREHNALEDARLLKCAYEKFFENLTVEA